VNEVIRKNADFIAILTAFGLLYGTWELTQWAESVYGKLPLDGADVLAEKPKVSSSGLEGLFPILIAGSGTAKIEGVDLRAIESAFRIKPIETLKSEVAALEVEFPPKPLTCAEQIVPRISVDAFTATSVVISGNVVRKGDQLNLPVQGLVPTVSDWNAAKGTVLIVCGKERITINAEQ